MENNQTDPFELFKALTFGAIPEDAIPEVATVRKEQMKLKVTEMTDDLQQIVRHYGIVQKVVEYIFAKNLGDTEAVKKELRSLNFIEFFELQKDFNEAYLREASIWKKIQNKER